MTQGYYLTNVWQHTKLLLMCLLGTALLLGLTHDLTDPVGAEQPDGLLAGELQPVTPAPADTTVEQQFAPGTPSATSAGYLRRDNAILTWTATGNGTIQDTYDVRMATTADVLPVTGELSGTPKSFDGLQSASLDITAEPSGTYFWQVRSCQQPIVCGPWSPVWTVTIDDVSPVVPSAQVATKPFDRNVRFVGTGEAGSTAVITVGDVTSQTIVLADGTWSVGFDEPFEYGIYEATVVLKDMAGNGSEPLLVPFAVKELFVAAQITVEELPETLDIVPVDETIESHVVKRPLVAVIDTVNTGISDKPMTDVTPLPTSARLSTDASVVQSSENGWQVFGLPWFLWAGIGGMLSATWVVTTGRLDRSSLGA